MFWSKQKTQKIGGKKTLYTIHDLAFSFVFFFFSAIF
jgi:glycogen synthase